MVHDPGHENISPVTGVLPLMLHDPGHENISPVMDIHAGNCSRDTLPD
jgi:hypothetical protein